MTQTRIMPGIKKLVNGELANMANGILNNFPDGEMIKAPPPKMALRAKKASKKKRTFNDVFDCIIAPVYYSINSTTSAMIAMLVFV